MVFASTQVSTIPEVMNQLMSKTGYCMYTYPLLLVCQTHSVLLVNEKSFSFFLLSLSDLQVVESYQHCWILLLPAVYIQQYALNQTNLQIVGQEMGKCHIEDLFY